MFEFGKKKKSSPPITDADLEDFKQKLDAETEAYKKKVDDAHQVEMKKIQDGIDANKAATDSEIAKMQKDHQSEMSDKFNTQAEEIQGRFEAGEIDKERYDREMARNKRMADLFLKRKV